jgi:hypothetical protein
MQKSQRRKSFLIVEDIFGAGLEVVEADIGRDV